MRQEPVHHMKQCEQLGTCLTGIAQRLTTGRGATEHTEVVFVAAASWGQRVRRYREPVRTVCRRS